MLSQDSLMIPNTLDIMLQCLREACQELPKAYSNFFMFRTLTGLRSSECVNCISPIKDPENFKTCYNEQRQWLEHFKFANLFICRTKAAYISLVNKEILRIAQRIEKPPIQCSKDGM